ncbi:hypothetical protein Pyn_18771 [Prunus yedoensis var. nudiflora]|uniref:Uncharacterized protein n=1 Tax=Prunus yedoensis var. nudiflora TaxID=2094558 RepID=A0A314ZSK0_PRUYE|nr:hypothetical protein Pyn_18771 [Prunus yedoensis var. nudiflora]
MPQKFYILGSDGGSCVMFTNKYSEGLPGLIPKDLEPLMCSELSNNWGVLCGWATNPAAVRP